MRISVKVKELLPLIKQHIKEKYGLKDGVELIYTSKTTFLSFDSLDNDSERRWCCWTLSEEEVLKAIKDIGVPKSFGLDESDYNRESFICDVVDGFKVALSMMGEEWEAVLGGVLMI